MEQTVDTRLGRIHFTSTGDGPPLVLLHSVGHDRHDFDAIAPALSRRFRVVAVDLPGHGASTLSLPARDVDAPAMFEALGEFMSKTTSSRDPAIVLGCSIGGAAAVHLAAHHPARVAGVVLVNSGGVTPHNTASRAFCWLMGREAVRGAVRMAFARRYLSLRNAHVEAILTRHEAFGAEPHAVSLEAAIWRSFARPESDVAELATKLSVPALLVWGRRDPVSRASVEGARARASLPHAEYFELDTGHAPFAEDPAAFLEVLTPFLEQVDARPSMRQDASELR
ncbi:MAG: alpha/beta fold hydrolase [Polyangiaceae bacterium]